MNQSREKPQGLTVSLVVQQGTANTDDDVEETGEEERAVQNNRELLLVVHGTLRRGAIERNSKTEAADAEHLRELLQRGRPQEGGFKMKFIMQTSVNDVENDGGYESEETANRHKRHGA